MARAMNVEKRLEAAKAIVERSISNAARAAAMAEELRTSFDGVKTEEAKAARELAKKLERLGVQLGKVGEAYATAF